MDFLHHLAIEAAIRLVDARRIDEYDLSCGTAALRLDVDHALDAGARGLRLFRDDGDLFPHQGIEQRALARVWTADDGDES
jgi:hypothetical protein